MSTNLLIFLLISTTGHALPMLQSHTSHTRPPVPQIIHASHGDISPVSGALDANPITATSPTTPSSLGRPPLHPVHRPFQPVAVNSRMAASCSGLIRQLAYVPLPNTPQQSQNQVIHMDIQKVIDDPRTTGQMIDCLGSQIVSKKARVVIISRYDFTQLPSGSVTWNNLHQLVSRWLLKLPDAHQNNVVMDYVTQFPVHEATTVIKTVAVGVSRQSPLRLELVKLALKAIQDRILIVQLVDLYQWAMLNDEQLFNWIWLYGNNNPVETFAKQVMPLLCTTHKINLYRTAFEQLILYMSRIKIDPARYVDSWTEIFGGFIRFTQPPITPSMSAGTSTPPASPRSAPISPHTPSRSETAQMSDNPLTSIGSSSVGTLTEYYTKLEVMLAAYRPAIGGTGFKSPILDLILANERTEMLESFIKRMQEDGGLDKLSITALNLYVGDQITKYFPLNRQTNEPVLDSNQAMQRSRFFLRPVTFSLLSPGVQYMYVARMGTALTQQNIHTMLTEPMDNTKFNLDLWHKIMVGIKSQYESLPDLQKIQQSGGENKDLYHKVLVLCAYMDSLLTYIQSPGLRQVLEYVRPSVQYLTWLRQEAEVTPQIEVSMDEANDFFDMPVEQFDEMMRRIPDSEGMVL